MVIVAFLALAVTARADALADLRQALLKMRASTPLALSARLDLDQHTRAGGQGVIEKGVIDFEITADAEGLSIRYPRALSKRAGEEEAAHRVDPDHPTPIRNAINSVQATEINDCLDFSAMLLREIEHAALVESREGSVDGKPARLLVVKVPPILSSFQKKHVKSLEVRVSIWLAADGLPAAVDRSSQLKASFFVVGVENVHKESWRLIRSGDRLIAHRHEEESTANGLGQNFYRKTILTLSPKP